MCDCVYSSALRCCSLLTMLQVHYPPWQKFRIESCPLRQERAYHCVLLDLWKAALYALYSHCWCNLSTSAYTPYCHISGLFHRLSNGLPTFLFLMLLTVINLTPVGSAFSWNIDVISWWKRYNDVGNSPVSWSPHFCDARGFTLNSTPYRYKQSTLMSNSKLKSIMSHSSHCPSWSSLRTAPLSLPLSPPRFTSSTSNS